MIIKKSDPMGFCFGVSRAIDIAEKLSNEGEIYCYGSLIHNVDEVERLAKRGVTTVDTLEKNMNLPILIRSHGVGKDVYAFLEENKLTYEDATCPFVKRIHEHVKKFLREGKDIAILGDKNHPEIQGIVSWGEGKIHVLADMQAVKNFHSGPELILLAQTTLKKTFFDEAVEYLSVKTKLQGINTICSATKRRQEAAENLAKEVELMLIVGGKKSSNTKKLYEICKNVNKNTFHIENIAELQVQDIGKYDIIGISAGASTPQWVIDKIVEYLQNET
ncbi:MAG: 4-hydroxy-3-methylbut-2-enyl diphosphate reductase [Tissierellia bacterium]|nr:4-hydroxy-3-methylbut-2-enyl diphosphate reductase [Tissierellia bacterium]